MAKWPKRDNAFLAWYPACANENEAAQVWEPRTAAFYVHIPFCSAICDYCGFAVTRTREANIGRYLDALKREIETYADKGRLANYRFDCGHFGGGTPSVLEAEQLTAIHAVIRQSFDVSPDAEVTVEVNPISFTTEKAEAYAASGVNRISVGIQSFDDSTLRVIGRPHRAGDVEQALKVLIDVGWDNFSLDIMYGGPGQTPEQLEADLIRAVDSGATHLSCFRLEIIPFTALKLREAAGLTPPRHTDQAMDELNDVVSEVLTNAGFREYGVFNYARPGYESIHNAIAFGAPQGEYIGFGNSSYSYINGSIFSNHAELSAYEEAVFAGRDPIRVAHQVTRYEEMSRYFVLGLKMVRVPRAPFVALFGLAPEDVFGSVLEGLIEDGALVREGDDYVVTPLGRYYINNVCKEFYVGASVGKGQHTQFVPTLTVDKVLALAKKRDKHLADKVGTES
jgi:oxygen-independent coproporphyrinogen III oxidase